MNKLFRIRTIQYCLVLVVCCLCISCSHLNVDFDSSWSARDITVVVVEHEQAPAEVATADIVSILTRSGWHVVADRDQAQARVVCRWLRQADLTSESEPIEVVKSFHVQVISVEQPRVLAVADYFYSNTDEELLDGVNAALAALTQDQVAPITAPVLQSNVQNSPPVVPQNPRVAPSSAAAVVKVSAVEPITAQSVSAAQDVNVTQPVAQLQIDQETLVVEGIPSVATEQATVEVLPLESAEPVSMEKSPWVPRFQGMGLDEWGK